MRILYISSYYKPAYIYGGPAKSIAAMCEALARQGAQVTVLTTNANGDELLNVPLEGPVDVDGVTVHYQPVTDFLPRTFFHSPALARACDGLVREHDVVVLETFFTYPTHPAVKACRKWNKPYIIPPRGQLLPWALGQKAFKKRVYLALYGRRQLDRAAGLQCTDPSEAQSIASLRLRAPGFIVPNGVDSRTFAKLPVRGLFRRKFGIPKNANLLLFVGRLHPKKRPDIVLDALSAVQSLPTETHLAMAGPDEMKLAPKLQSQAGQLGCADKFHTAGLLKEDELLSALVDSDLLLMPSEPESENFGMSALEAMAAGLPILVSDGVPVGYWAEKAGAGRMVPCMRDDFKRAAREMLSDPKLLKEMGNKGQALARQQFDIEIIARQMLAQYQAILSQGKPLPDLQLAEV